MTATSLMDPHPTVLKPTDIIKTGIGYIMENRYRNLPVVDNDGLYLGSFGVHCLLKHVLPKASLMKRGLDNVSFIQTTLEDLYHRVQEIQDNPISMCMNTETVTVSPDTPLVEALYTLYQARDSLPVVDADSGQLVGVISYWDAGRSILSAAPGSQEQG